MHVSVCVRVCVCVTERESIHPHMCAHVPVPMCVSLCASGVDARQGEQGLLGRCTPGLHGVKKTSWKK